MFLQLKHQRFGRNMKYHLFDTLNNGEHQGESELELEPLANIFNDLLHYEFGFDVMTLDSNNTEIEDASYCIYTGPAENKYMRTMHLAHYFTEIQFYEKFDDAIQEYTLKCATQDFEVTSDPVKPHKDNDKEWESLIDFVQFKYANKIIQNYNSMSFLNMERYNAALLVGVYESEEEYLMLLNALKTSYEELTNSEFDETKI